MITVICGNILSVICLIEMAPKKRTRNDAGASSSQPAFDEDLFVSERAFERYKLLSVKNVIQDRGMECKDDYRHEPQYAEIKRQIVARGWQKFVNVPKETNESLMLEFLANWPEKNGDNLFIRRRWIPVTSNVINTILVNMTSILGTCSNRTST